MAAVRVEPRSTSYPGAITCRWAVPGICLDAAWIDLWDLPWYCVRGTPRQLDSPAECATCREWQALDDDSEPPLRRQ